jgi:hypothetical protein
MSRRFERDDNSGKVVLIVIGSVVGGFLLLILACAGLTFFLVYRASQQMGPALQAQGELMAAQGTAQMFLNQLSWGQVNDAYNTTTAGFRGRQTLAEFQAFLQRNPLLTKFTAAEPDPVNNAPGAQRLTLPFVLTAGNDITKVSVHVVREGNDWRVDNVTVP